MDTNIVPNNVAEVQKQRRKNHPRLVVGGVQGELPGEGETLKLWLCVCMCMWVCVWVCVCVSMCVRVGVCVWVCESLCCVSVQPHGLQPTRLLRPRDSPGKNTGAGKQKVGHSRQGQTHYKQRFRVGMGIRADQVQQRICFTWGWTRLDKRVLGFPTKV